MIEIGLPAADAGGQVVAGSLEWLVGQLRGGVGPFAGSTVRLAITPGEAIEIGDGRGLRVSIPVPEQTGHGAAVEIAPGLRVPPADAPAAARVLSDAWQGLDHIGINLSDRAIANDAWTQAVATIAAALPAYRLDVGNGNDIVMIVDEDAHGRPAVLELVRDRAATRSSVHLCAAVSATRDDVERAFPAPVGAYKPGDEPFFRSIALPASLTLPAYLDLAFSDGGMTPWPQIVAAMGQRIA